MRQRSGSARAGRWVAAADPKGLLYGAVVSAAVLATASSHAKDSARVGVVTALVLVIYWMAHVYVDTLASRFGGDARPALARLRRSSAKETSVLKGGVPAIVVYVVASASGADPADAAAVAVYFSVALLAAVGYLGALQAGLRGRAVLLDVAGAAAFGVLIVAAKTLLH